MRSQFKIIKAKNTKGEVYFIARFTGPDGKPYKQVSIHEKTRQAATREADRLLREGEVSSALNPLAIYYIRDFWRNDSEYVIGRNLRRREPLSASYLNTQLYCFKLFEPAFKGKNLLDIDAAFMERVIQKLSKEHGAQAINSGLDAVKIPVSYFCKKHHLPNLLQSVEKLAVITEERGIPTIEEIRAMLALNDEGPRIKCALTLGAFCGLRLGEIRALTFEAVDEKNGLIHITKNFVLGETKNPKTGSKRIVPAPRVVFDLIKECSELTEGRYVVYQADPGKPIDGGTLQAAIVRCYNKIGISREAMKARKIVPVHSLRHFYVSIARAAGIPGYLVQKLSGHKTTEMLDRYSHAENMIDFTKAREALEAQLKVSGEAKR